MKRAIVAVVLIGAAATGIVVLWPVAPPPAPVLPTPTPRPVAVAEPWPARPDVLEGSGNDLPPAPTPPAIEPLAPENPLADASEDRVTELDFLLNDLCTAVVNLAGGQVREAFTSDFAGPTPFDPWPAPTRRLEIAGVTLTERGASEAGSGEAWASFAAGFNRITHASIKVTQSESHEPDRSRCVTRWVIRGDGRIEVDEKFRTTFVRKNGRWRIAAQSRLEGVRRESDRPAFRDVTAAMGVTVPAGLRCRRLSEAELAERRAAGQSHVPGEQCHGCSYFYPYLYNGGVAVGDYDADGRPDVYVSRADRNILLRNVEGRRFEDVSDRAGVAAGGRGSGALWLDADGDGRLDLLAAAFCCRVDREPCRRGALTFFRNRGDGTFEDRTAAGFSTHGAASSLSAADIDGDGDLDVFVTFYNRKNSQFPGPESFFDARNGEPDRLFRNNGDGTFTEISEVAGVADVGWGFACLMADLTDDGRPDIYVANDFGRNSLFVNLDGARFEERSAAMGADDLGFGMGVTLADFDGDGRLDLHVSNMYSTAGGRVIESAGAALPSEVRAKMEKARAGNSLLKGRGDGKFKEIGEEAGIRKAGWAWGSVAIDTFHVGRPDLYVANGLMTGVSRVDL